MQQIEDIQFIPIVVKEYKKDSAFKCCLNILDISLFLILAGTLLETSRSTWGEGGKLTVLVSKRLSKEKKILVEKFLAAISLGRLILPYNPK